MKQRNRKFTKLGIIFFALFSLNSISFSQKLQKKQSQSSNSSPASIQSVKTVEIHLKGCIPIYRTNNFVIKDKKIFIRQIPDDARKKRCMGEAEKIDFDKLTLIGTLLRSGHCQRPAGLQFTTKKNKDKKEYLFEISYLKPDASCRALSRYELWVTVPKLPEGYTVNRKISAKLNK